MKLNPCRPTFKRSPSDYDPNEHRPLNILLTNGRFPVSIDVARQLHLAGHNIFVVDPMHYHVCKFSNVVYRSHYVPAPHVDAEGYLKAVEKAIREDKIDLVLPLHEEIFFLVSMGSDMIQERLFACDWKTLLTLHNKWEFSKFLRRIGLDTPDAFLIKSAKELREKKEELQLDKLEYALKPIYGRACAGVHHLKPDKEPDWESLEKDINDDNHYIAQRWLYGKRYCSYSIVRRNRVVLLGIYPVRDTLDDGSSCVYFESIQHTGILHYHEKIAERLPKGINSCQIALDFIETETTNEESNETGTTTKTITEKRLYAIECNPRATSGIHLFSGTTLLADIIAGDLTPPDPNNKKGFRTPPKKTKKYSSSSPPSDGTSYDASITNDIVIPRPGASRQVAPGMLMYSRKKSDHGFKQYLSHMKRLMSSKDVIFSLHDIAPSLMQPFLLTSYYEICRERQLKLPEMFQWDVTWEPKGETLRKAYALFEEDEAQKGEVRSGDSVDDEGVLLLGKKGETAEVDGRDEMGRDGKLAGSLDGSDEGVGWENGDERGRRLGLNA
ncbi:hypothetical protein BJ508DRAFT_230966 [Ascobolus immersus RN42]|uniref:ATP-grasp domain-containing protein n=1 Tax=Ascobolus immersus RN42 TaxID=1160509 RepID=A0A3N4HWI9_ASCIM|nr:hypothetical protein BJ508DRAFT_230966 [Ascobolus immersus RN42]